MEPPPAPIRFDIFEFDPDASQLRRKGFVVKLAQQPIRLLAILLERPGELFTREELQQRLWESNVYVDFDQGLNKSIKKLRDALGDSAESPRYVETVPRVGYRFIAPVHKGRAQESRHKEKHVPVESPMPSTSEVDLVSTADLLQNQTGKAPAFSVSSTSTRARGHRAWCGVAILGVVACAVAASIMLHRAAASPIQALAVLPLVNLSGDPGQDYFADGMTDELITELAHTPHLRVVSRTSVMRDKGSHKSLKTIATELGVDAVVEGSVVRSGNRVRITAQLIDTRSDKHLWAETFERQADDILSLQDDVTAKIAEGARVALTNMGAHSDAPLRINAEAHDSLLLGRYFLEKRDARKSVDSFEKAISLQPDYAAAYAGLSQGLDSEYLLGIASRDSVSPRILAAARRAVELDSTSSEAYVALGTAEMTYAWNWDAAEKDLRRAINLEPNNSDAEHRYAIYLDSVDRPEEAVTHMRRALQLDPLSFFKNRHMASTLYFARRYNEAIPFLDRASEMEPNLRGVVDNWRSWIAIAQGNQQEAIRFDLSVLQLHLPLATITGFQSVYRHDGWKAYWLARRQAPQHQSDLGCLAYDQGVSSILAEDTESAFIFLNKAVDGGCFWMTSIQDDPRFDPLRNDARYLVLLKRLRFRQ